jgi:hypothetical protein
MTENTTMPPILQEMLTKLATELKEPEISSLMFVQNNKDFDNRRYSLKEPAITGGCVAKIGINELDDAQTTHSVRRQLEERLRATFLSHYGAEKKVSSVSS